MLINEVLSQYSFKDLSTFTLTESAGNWQISQSSAFKKGWKKHAKDQRVFDAFTDLMNFVKMHDGVPPIREYPIQYNVHQIKQDKRFQNTLWAHLKGQKIGLLFSVEPGLVKLIHIGTHQEIGWS